MSRPIEQFEAETATSPSKVRPAAGATGVHDVYLVALQLGTSTKIDNIAFR